MRDNLKRLVEYASNPEKTEYGSLARTLHYAENDAKTVLSESVQLVSGIHCRAQQAGADMRAVQERFGKTNGIVAYHAYQSFKPGEVTPQQCHEIGLELANKVWGYRFQVLVATHMNTGCLHNHFAINAVSYVDGKKYEQKRSQYYDLRRMSDKICRERQLSVIEKPGGKTPRPLYEAEKRGEPTRYNLMRRAIRQAMTQASTERDFARALQSLGYRWRRDETRKYATLQALDGGRAVRIYRLGAGYDWPDILRALSANLAQYGPRYYDLCNDPRYGFKEFCPAPERRVGRYSCRNLHTARRKSGLWGSYLHYCYKMGIYPKPAPSRINWPELQAQWRNVEQICREMQFVSEHRFQNVGEVAAYRENVDDMIARLIQERADCVRQLRRKDPLPDAAQRRAELTSEIKKLRAENSLAEQVIKRVRTIEEHQRAFKQMEQAYQQEKANRKPKRHDHAR